VTPTQTTTFYPTITRLPTRTITFTPTITSTGTAYPTFNPLDAQTRTPAPPAVCPTGDPDIQISIPTPMPDYLNYFDLVDGAEEALLTGAPLQQVLNVYDKAYATDWQEVSKRVFPIDLTGDGIDEAFLRGMFGFLVFGCENGGNKLLYQYYNALGYPFSPDISFQDANHNGITDILIEVAMGTGHNSMFDLREWDGSKFVSLFVTEHSDNARQNSPGLQALFWYNDVHNYFEEYGDLPVMNGLASVEFIDLTQNGFDEIILRDYGPMHMDTLNLYGPWRGKTMVFEWDGLHFIYTKLEMDPPQYRFQAIQDADRLFLANEYERALEMYREVIFSNDLDWWSQERKNYFSDQYMFSLWSMESGESTPSSPTPMSPPVDTDEYLELSAYARYRIVLHHVTQGWLGDAGTVNQTLQREYPVGKPGHEYAVLATLFLEAYERSGDLELACIPLVAYTESHPELLAPLGGSQHGHQSHIYVPHDLCPFAE
jgi:hypothetical protein